MQLTRKQQVAIVMGGLVAFTVVGTGGAVAGRLITGDQIQDGTIRLADINDADETALKGQKGDPGTNGVTGLQTVEAAAVASAPAGSYGSGDAICPAGKKAIGGGFWLVNGGDGHFEDFNVIEDQPIDNNNAWRVGVWNPDTNGNGTGTMAFRVYAVCATVN